MPQSLFSSVHKSKLKTATEFVDTIEQVKITKISSHMFDIRKRI